MNLSFANKVSAPADVLVQELDGESVFLNLKEGRYFGLDPVGTRMWQVLTNSASVEQAYQTLLNEYEVDPEQLRQDLLGLLGRLAEHGLVEVQGDPVA